MSVLLLMKTDPSVVRVCVRELIRNLTMKPCVLSVPCPDGNLPRKKGNP